MDRIDNGFQWPSFQRQTKEWTITGAILTIERATGNEELSGENQEARFPNGDGALFQPNPKGLGYAPFSGVSSWAGGDGQTGATKSSPFRQSPSHGALESVDVWA